MWSRRVLIALLICGPACSPAEDRVVGDWELWSVEGQPANQAPWRRDEFMAPVDMEDPATDSVGFRNESRLLDARLELFADGQWRETATRQARSFVNLRHLAAIDPDAPPFWTPSIPEWVPVSTDTAPSAGTSIGEWELIADSVVLWASREGFGSALGDRFLPHVGVEEREQFEQGMDSLLEEVGGEQYRAAIGSVDGAVLRLRYPNTEQTVVFRRAGAS